MSGGDSAIAGLVDADLLAAFPAGDEAAWHALVETALKGHDFDKALRTRTRDGFTVGPLYGQQGTAPARVGRAAAGPWTISQRVDHPDPETAAGFALADLEGGADGLTLVSRTAAAANGFGVALQAESLSTILSEVLLDLVRLRMDAGPERTDALPMLAEIARARELSPAQIALDPGFDPAADVANGIDDALTQEAHGAILQTIAGIGFGGTIASADGRVAGDAGASDSQELGFVLAGLLAHLKAAEAGGMDLEAVSGRLEAIVTAGPDTFASLAKLRAIRMLFARVLESAGLSGRPLRVHAETAWAHISAADPYVNMLRATSAVAGAGLGGADSILVQPLTAALGLSDGFSRRMSRNIQLVLTEESFLEKVTDPAAGSGYLDQRSTALAEAAWAMFQKIETEGGVTPALQSGMVGDMIAQSRAALESDLARRAASLTGVTEFAAAKDTLPDVLPVESLPSEASKALLPRMRWAEPFEALRARGTAWQGDSDKPAIFLAAIGALPEFNARATFARNTYAIAGLDCMTGEGGTDIAAIVAEAASSGAKLVCLTASDEAYAEHGPGLAAALNAAGVKHIHLAGKPDDAMQAAGIRTGPALRGDVLSLLNETLKTIGG
jgi:methylmalonyl-CoA mutase